MLVRWNTLQTGENTRQKNKVGTHSLPYHDGHVYICEDWSSTVRQTSHNRHKSDTMPLWKAESRDITTGAINIC